MKNIPFDDIYFVRLKLQKSIHRPKSPLKSPNSTLQPLLSSIPSPRPFSPLKCIKQQKRLPTKNEIDTWIVKKQIKVKEFINKQNRIDESFSNPNLNSDQIRFRKRSNQDQSLILKQKESKKPKDLSTDGKLSQTSLLNSKFTGLKTKLNCVNTAFRQVKTSNLSPVQYYKQDYQKHIKLNERTNYYPFLLKSVQRKQKLQKHQDFEQSQKCPLMKTDQIQKGISLTQSCKKFKLFQRTKSSIHKNSNSISLIQSIDQSRCIRDRSPQRKSLTRSINLSTEQSQKSSFRSPIYQDNLKGNRLIKKYSFRETSPDEKRDLKNKYSRLQKRLDGILRSVRTEKQNSD